MSYGLNLHRTSAGFFISHTAGIPLYCFTVLPKRVRRHPRESLKERCAIRQIMKEGVTMNKASAKFSEIKELLMKDEEFKAEYEKLKPRYDVISQIIEARKSLNMTQEELALRVGTQKSNISRLESGTYNPSLDFLTKVARSLGKEMQVTLK